MVAVRARAPRAGALAAAISAAVLLGTEGREARPPASSGTAAAASTTPAPPAWSRHGFSGWAFVLLVALLLLYCSCADCGRRLAKYIVDPRRGTHKYVLLCLICLFIPGPYFHDGLIAALKSSISTDMGLSNSEFASLFAVSSFTGILCCPAGGLIARFGRIRFALLASSLTFVGSSTTTLGLRAGALGLVLLGRFIFWLALNALLMSQTIIVYDLFKGKDLNFAMTLIVCSIRLGGSLCYPLSGPLLDRLGVQNAMWFSVVLVFGGLIATGLFAYLFDGTKVARAVRPMMETRSEVRAVSFSLIRYVPRSAVFFLCGLAAAWGVVFPFEVIGDDMLQTEFGYSVDQAGCIIAIAPAVSIFSPGLAPFLGTTLYQKLLACTTGLALLCFAFLVLFAGFPICGVGLVGVGYAVSVCACYSTMPLLIRSALPAPISKQMENLVVGLNMAGSGTVMIVSNLAIGYIKDHASYRWACLYLAAMGAWGVLSLALAAITHRPLGTPRTDPSAAAAAEGHQELAEFGALSTIIFPAAGEEALTPKQLCPEVPLDGASNNMVLSLAIEERYY